MNRPIRIAAQIHPQHGSFADLRAAAIHAETLRYDIVYNWDHFFPLYGDRNGPHYECWTTLACWSEVTEKIEIGPLVTCNSYRNPQILADMARTIDQNAGGRVILGLGSGWFRRDFDEYGYTFGTAAGRLRHLESSLPAIEQRLKKLNPPPPRDMPILIAGGGETITLRLVAQHADSWHAGFPSNPNELIRKVEALGRWCREIGRDPGDIEWGIGIEPEDVGQHKQADAYLELGFTQFTLGFNGPRWSVENGREWLAWRDERNRDRT